MKWRPVSGVRWTAESLLASGRLPRPVRFGRARRWADEQLDAFITAEIERAGGYSCRRGGAAVAGRGLPD